MTRAATAWPAASPTCCARRKKTAPGMSRYYTGTGFPRVFYLMYHMYRQYFPLLALTTYKQSDGGNGNSSA